MSEYSLKDLPGFLRDLSDSDSEHEPEYYVFLEECARIIEGKPINMGHVDAIQGALHSAEYAIKQGHAGEALADIQRAVVYAHKIKKRLPEGDGFGGEKE